MYFVILNTPSMTLLALSDCLSLVATLSCEVIQLTLTSEK